MAPHPAIPLPGRDQATARPRPSHAPARSPEFLPGRAPLPWALHAGRPPARPRGQNDHAELLPALRPFYSNTRPGAPLTPTQNTRGHTLPTLLRVRDRQRAAARTQPHLPPHRRAPHNFAVPPPPSGALAPPRLELFGLPAGPPGPVPSFSGRPPPAPVLSESLGRGPKL